MTHPKALEELKRITPLFNRPVRAVTGREHTSPYTYTHDFIILPEYTITLRGMVHFTVWVKDDNTTGRWTRMTVIPMTNYTFEEIT